MLGLKENRSYRLQRDFRVLEREQRVTKILGSHAFREELEGILQGQLDGSRNAPKLSRALGNLQDNVVPASTIEAAHRQTTAAASLTSGVSSTVLQINDLRGVRTSRYILAERQLRCKLASLCRLVDWFKWSQLVHNHVSARGVGERDEFLMNPFGLLYCEVTASSLIRVNRNGVIVDGGSTQLGVNRTGMELHSVIYEARRDVKCVMHLHTIAGTAVSIMTCGLLPISEEAKMLGKVSYYDGRKSLTGSKEKKDFVKALGKNKVLILKNHGLVALGKCVEECFYLMYNLIQACQIQVAASSVGLANLISPVEDEYDQGESMEEAKVWTMRGQMEFEALMRMLDNQGYQTGYKYCGLSLLQTGANNKAVWDEIVEGGETDNANRQQRRKEMIKAAKQRGKSKKEMWSFLDDNRSRDKPLTKNTKIRVRGRSDLIATGSISPVTEESGSRDPWEFLTTRDSTAESKGGSLPSTAQQYTSGGSMTEDMVHTTANTSHHSSATGRRRARRRKANRSSSSTGQSTTPVAVNSMIQSTKAPPLHTPDQTPAVQKTPQLPPDLTMLEQTAERVAHSTGVSVQKLSKKLTEEETDTERTLNEPTLNTMPSSWGDDYLTSNRDIPPPLPPSRLLQSSHLQHDSQGYSSGDEASNTGSPHKIVQHRLRNRQSTSPLNIAHEIHPHNIQDDTSSQQHQHNHTHLDQHPSQLEHTHTPHATSFAYNHHTDIVYPNGYSSAEKAAYVARLVADSTGTAVQKLSETMSERKQLSNSTHSSTHNFK